MGTKSKVSQVIWAGVDTNASQYRVVRDAHGIRMDVLFNGLVGDFDFTTLLLQVTTSLALLALATTVTDQVMLFLMTYRRDYHAAKYEEVDPEEEDFDLYSGGKAQALVGGAGSDTLATGSNVHYSRAHS